MSNIFATAAFANQNTANVLNQNPNTYNIPLNGQMEAGAPVTIDRTFPAILDGHMSQSTWNLFCEEIDVTLRPILPMKKKIQCLTYTSLVLFLLPILLIPLIVTRTISSNGASFIGSPGFIALMISPMLVLITMGCITRKVAEGAAVILEDVKKVCSTESSKYSSISFVVRDTFSIMAGNNRVRTIRNNYIDVTVSGGNAASTMEDGYAGFSMPPIGGTGKDAATRLQDLEGIRSLITPEEYEEKRSAILAGV